VHPYRSSGDGRVVAPGRGSSGAERELHEELVAELGRLQGELRRKLEQLAEDLDDGGRGHGLGEHHHRPTSFHIRLAVSSSQSG
jgi:hypothetical protein